MDIRIDVKNIGRGKRDFSVQQLNIPVEHFDEAFKSLKHSLEYGLGLSFSAILNKVKLLEYKMKEANFKKIDKIVLGRGAFEKVKDSFYEPCNCCTQLEPIFQLIGYPVRVDDRADDYYVGIQVADND